MFISVHLTFDMKHLTSDIIMLIIKIKKISGSDNLMNVNQNFKNQIWAAQSGSPNAREQLENYISWLITRRQMEIDNMAVKCASDTLGLETDSLINYLASSAILKDRIIRYSLLLSKSDYNNALNELPVINSLTSDLSIEKQLEYNNFVNVSEILIDVLQLPDSTADSLILTNQAYLESIANTEFHVAQGDAKALLEKAGITQEYIAWLPDGSTAKSFRISDKIDPEIPELCESLIIYPNPSNGLITIECNLLIIGNNLTLELTNILGQVVLKTTFTSDGKNEISIQDLANGLYMYRILGDDGNVLIEDKLVISE